MEVHFKAGLDPALAGSLSETFKISLKLFQLQYYWALNEKYAGFSIETFIKYNLIERVANSSAAVGVAGSLMRFPYF